MRLALRAVDLVPALLLLALLLVLLVVTGLLPSPSVSAGGSTRDAGTYAPLFRSAAARYPRVHASQLAAQARAESGFDPRATSPAGARGLMQVMPATFAGFAVDGDGDGRRDPYDAADSVFTAAHYLDHLSRQLRLAAGDDRVVAAYNAGPGAVRRAGGVPAYAETRGYVAKVGRWTPTYRWLDG